MKQSSKKDERKESFGSYQTYATEGFSFMNPSQITSRSEISSREGNIHSSRSREATRAIPNWDGEQAQFERIENILSDENQNLRQQNNFLKGQVGRLRNYANLYKMRFEEAKAKLALKELECETQREKGQQLKKIITQHLLLMEQKMLKEESTHEEYDLLKALNESEILPK